MQSQRHDAHPFDVYVLHSYGLLHLLTRLIHTLPCLHSFEPHALCRSAIVDNLLRSPIWLQLVVLSLALRWEAALHWEH